MWPQQLLTVSQMAGRSKHHAGGVLSPVQWTSISVQNLIPNLLLEDYTIYQNSFPPIWPSIHSPGIHSGEVLCISRDYACNSGPQQLFFTDKRYDEHFRG
jgi:hypothetical protein